MMRIPTMAATVERRLLINYRLDPDLAATLLPPPFRPRLAGGVAVAGICLIRLGQLRPSGLPAAAGIRTENAAHRIAVEYDAEPGQPPRTGVFIPTRHSASRLTCWLGGRLFPGAHHHARFTSQETPHHLRVAFADHTGPGHLDVTVRVTDSWPGSTLFADLQAASEFFRLGGDGYSPGRDPRQLDGLRLHTTTWRVQPATVTHATSSFFDDPATFPPGTAELDTALLMRHIPVTWHALPPLPTSQPTTATPR